MLLALLGMAWAEVQQPQLQEEQTPVPGGKGLCVRHMVEVCRGVLASFWKPV